MELNSPPFEERGASCALSAWFTNPYPLTLANGGNPPLARILPCSCAGMWKKFGRLFVIKTRFEACAVIYALGLGAIERGFHYMQVYPGFGGWLLFAACTAAVFMAGARLMEVTRKDNRQRRRRSDYSPRSTKDWEIRQLAAAA